MSQLKSADILIIGSGVIGASCAYHLASGGCKNVVVIDSANKPGDGSTSRATGGFRCQFVTEINVKLSLLSREKLLRFKDELGTDPGYQPYGYLFIASSESELNSLQQAQRVQRKTGLTEVDEVSTEDINRLSPAVAGAGIVGGSFCQTDGFINPMNMLLGYKQAAERLGVHFEFGSECYGFKFEKGGSGSSVRVSEIFTPRDDVSVGSVVNAAGAWAGIISRMADLEIPVKPVRRHVAVVNESGILPDTTPMTIFAKDGFHFRVRDGRTLLLLPEDTPSSDAYDITVDNNWVEKVRRIAYQRVPCLSGRKINPALCWAGLYEMTPDKHAILGLAPGFENFYLVNGSSGHGVMHSPALGQLVSELILDGTAKSVNIHPLRPSRFDENDLNQSSDIL